MKEKRIEKELHELLKLMPGDEYALLKVTFGNVDVSTGAYDVYKRKRAEIIKDLCEEQRRREKWNAKYFVKVLNLGAMLADVIRNESTAQARENAERLYFDPIRDAYSAEKGKYRDAEKRNK